MSSYDKLHLYKHSIDLFASEWLYNIITHKKYKITTTFFYRNKEASKGKGSQIILSLE